MGASLRDRTDRVTKDGSQEVGDRAGGVPRRGRHGGASSRAARRGPLPSALPHSAQSACPAHRPRALGPPGCENDLRCFIHM
eukprot:1717533-Pyramimonas_sp.AAC.1